MQQVHQHVKQKAWVQDDEEEEDEEDFFTI